MHIVTLFKQWWSDAAHTQRYASLSSFERDALARDVGLPEGTLHRIVNRGSRAGEELGRMLRALSLNPEHVAEQNARVLREMSITCTTCEAKKECRRDLASGTAAQSFQRYCPNAPVLAELEAERWAKREKLLMRIGVA